MKLDCLFSYAPMDLHQDLIQSQYHGALLQVRLNAYTLPRFKD